MGKVALPLQADSVFWNVVLVFAQKISQEVVNDEHTSRHAHCRFSQNDNTLVAWKIGFLFPKLFSVFCLIMLITYVFQVACTLDYANPLQNCGILAKHGMTITIIMPIIPN